jgi:hypothetical protein
MKVVQDAMTEKLCASDMRATTAAGASVTYEYWTPGHTRKLGENSVSRLARRLRRQLTERRRLPAFWDTCLFHEYVGCGVRLRMQLAFAAASSLEHAPFRVDP